MATFTSMLAKRFPWLANVVASISRSRLKANAACAADAGKSTNTPPAPIGNLSGHCLNLLTNAEQGKTPRWDAICNSDAWNGEIVPMIEQQLAHVLRGLVSAGVESEFRFAQGKAAGLLEILNLPDTMAALERVRRQQMTETEPTEDTTNAPGRNRRLRRNGTNLRPLY